MVYFWCSGESRKDAMMVLASFTKLPARWAKVLLCALALVAVATAASAGKIKVVPPEGADWQRHAETYLSAYKENRPFSLQLDKPGRCVKANNYGCMWQPTTNWEGTPGPDGTNGAHDGEGINNGHAIFSHPKWSIIAAMRWFERRTDGGRAPKSALQLAEKYSPWCDTLGSVATKADKSDRVWGRSCPGGNRPPRGFSGPRCREPADKIPVPGQCQACNCPSAAAKFWLKDTGRSINEPLPLFDSSGRPTPLMSSMIGWKVALETGRFKPTPALLNEAAQGFRPESR